MEASQLFLSADPPGVEVDGPMRADWLIGAFTPGAGWDVVFWMREAV